MKTTALLTALLIGMVVPGFARADEPAVSFEARWPETPMRKPDMVELIRLVASAAKDDINSVIASSDQRQALRCHPELCRVLHGR